MVSQEQMLTEMAVLNEKIESFEQLLKSKTPKKGDYHQFIARKLAEYRQKYDKLTSSYSDFYGDEGVTELSDRVERAS